jgi:hypothetical protein
LAVGQHTSRVPEAVNIRTKLPNETAAEVLAHVYAMRDAPTLDAARAVADSRPPIYRAIRT